MINFCTEGEGAEMNTILLTRSWLVKDTHWHFFIPPAHPQWCLSFGRRNGWRWCRACPTEGEATNWKLLIKIPTKRRGSKQSITPFHHCAHPRRGNENVCTNIKPGNRQSKMQTIDSLSPNTSFQLFCLTWRHKYNVSCYRIDLITSEGRLMVDGFWQEKTSNERENGNEKSGVLAFVSPQDWLFPVDNGNPVGRWSKIVRALQFWYFQRQHKDSSQQSGQRSS